VVNLYRSSVEQQSMLTTSAEGGIRMLKAEVTGQDGEQIRSGEPLNLRFVVRSPEKMFGAFHIGISQGTAQPVFVLRYASSFPEGEFELNCRLQTLPLPKGRYSLWAAMRAPVGSGITAEFAWQPVASFEAFGPSVIKAPTGVMVLSPVYVPADWQLT
ncbi:MAG: hypothetical protein ACRD6W_01490, partial [Nitrososphaerales archaeon]